MLFLFKCGIVYKLLSLIILFFSSYIYATPLEEAQDAFQYYLHELAQDNSLTHEQQHEKVQEFKTFRDELSLEVSTLVTSLLLEENRVRVIEMFQKAGLNESELLNALINYDKAVCNVEKMTVETARQMAFFIGELKLHRKYVYEFGALLGCPEKQLLRHDLCKLNQDQFEGYARYFRGSRQEEDKLAYLAAWQEHHHECYSKEGFDFDTFPEEILRNNMLEVVADLLAATKQRGGSTLTEWLLTDFPKKNPHPRLIPYLEEALIKAHSFYLESETNPDFCLFKDLPCWNKEIAEHFSKLKIVPTSVEEEIQLIE